MLSYQKLSKLFLIMITLFVVAQPLVEVLNTYLEVDYELCDSVEEKEDKSQESETEITFFKHSSSAVIPLDYFLMNTPLLDQIATLAFYFDEYAKVVPSPPPDNLA
jgi:short subunit fatty acids transporter